MTTTTDNVKWSSLGTTLLACLVSLLAPAYMLGGTNEKVQSDHEKLTSLSSRMDDTDRRFSLAMEKQQDTLVKIQEVVAAMSSNVSDLVTRSRQQDDRIFNKVR